MPRFERPATIFSDAAGLPVFCLAGAFLLLVFFFFISVISFMAAFHDRRGICRPRDCLCSIRHCKGDQHHFTLAFHLISFIIIIFAFIILFIFFIFFILTNPFSLSTHSSLAT